MCIYTCIETKCTFAYTLTHTVFPPGIADGVMGILDTGNNPYTYTHVRAQMYVHTQSHIRMSVHTCTYIHSHTYTYPCTHVSTQIQHPPDGRELITPGIFRVSELPPAVFKSNRKRESDQ